MNNIDVRTAALLALAGGGALYVVQEHPSLGGGLSAAAAVMAFLVSLLRQP